MRSAERLAAIAFSPIRAMHQGAPAGAVPLGLGEPTWDLPAPARRALAAAAEASGPCAYGPNGGVPALVEAIAGFHGQSPERVMAAAGSQGALFALFQAWLDPFDEVLVPDPGFLAYPILARLAGAIPVPYPLKPDGSFDAEAFEAVLSAHPFAKAAVMNHPSNPTGGGAGAEDYGRASRACASRDVLLLSDEVYRELYLGERPASLADAGEGGVVLGSVSKAWGGPGLRVGWALADPAILAPARLVHNYMVTSLARPAQEAAAALLEASGEILPAARAELAARWEALAEALRGELGMEAARPAGAFYYWLALPESARGDPTAFCLRVRDEGGAIVVPGIAFGSGGRGSARLSYAARPEALREGVRRLAPFWR